MTLDDVNEAVSLLGAVLTALQAAVPGQSGRSGAAFRYACGGLIAQAPTLIPTFALGAPLEGCFTAALTAGATLSGLAGVRQAVTSFAYTSRVSVLVGGACYGYALSGEAQILAQTTFPCSEDALSALAYVSAAIQAGEDWTLDRCVPVQYQALLALGAAVTLDLQARAASLPRVTTYSYVRGTSSLVLAYSLYGDAGRADELRAENQANNPAFMPPSGTALSE